MIWWSTGYSSCSLYSPAFLHSSHQNSTKTRLQMGCRSACTAEWSVEMTLTPSLEREMNKREKKLYRISFYTSTISVMAITLTLWVPRCLEETMFSNCKFYSKSWLSNTISVHSKLQLLQAHTVFWASMTYIYIYPAVLKGLREGTFQVEIFTEFTFAI